MDLKYWPQGGSTDPRFVSKPAAYVSHFLPLGYYNGENLKRWIYFSESKCIIRNLNSTRMITVLFLHKSTMLYSGIENRKVFFLDLNQAYIS